MDLTNYVVKQATAEDYKENVILQLKEYGTLYRILRHVRDDSFATVCDGVSVEITLHSREAHCFNVLTKAS
jgi:hypothetical protein